MAGDRITSVHSVDFAKQIDDWCKKAKGRIAAVAKTAAQKMADVANTPTAQGGKMRVDTGFLRSTIGASTNGIPSGASEKPAGALPNSFTPKEITTAIARWDVETQTLSVGWTANYAIWRELHDGFLEAALQKWPSFVDDAIAEAKRRIK